jgi:hypothetical protein
VNLSSLISWLHFLVRIMPFIIWNPIEFKWWSHCKCDYASTCEFDVCMFSNLVWV